MEADHPDLDLEEAAMNRDQDLVDMETISRKTSVAEDLDHDHLEDMMVAMVGQALTLTIHLEADLDMHQDSEITEILTQSQMGTQDIVIIETHIEEIAISLIKGLMSRENK